MKTIKNALLALLAVVIVVGGTYTAIKWDMIVDKWQTEADREVFKQTTTYSEAAASFLADRGRDGFSNRQHVPKQKW